MIHFNNLTTAYVFRSRTGSGSAPLHWITQSLLSVIPPTQRGKENKIMIGLNFFGVQFSTRGSNPIIFREYLEILEKQQPAINWSEEFNEHIFTYYTKDTTAWTVYYPTLKVCTSSTTPTP
jgi:spore germination protein YaaH